MHRRGQAKQPWPALLLVQEEERGSEGVVGGVEYAGPIEEFLPLLYMGQLTHVGKRAEARDGRNPQTGEKMRIPAQKVPTFSAGNSLKESV